MLMDLMLTATGSDTTKASVARRLDGGFSLVEVMVAVIVLCVGLLGIARMHSLALSSTTVAAQRSLAAIEADGLASMMHANRGYWIGTDATDATINIQSTTFSYTGAPLLSGAGTPSCTAVAGPWCTPVQLAAYDLQDWATQLQAVLPGATTSIQCGHNTPQSCLLTISWSERAVAVNSQEANAAGTPASMQNPTYILYVQP